MPGFNPANFADQPAHRASRVQPVRAKALLLEAFPPLTCPAGFLPPGLSGSA